MEKNTLDNVFNAHRNISFNGFSFSFIVFDLHSVKISSGFYSKEAIIEFAFFKNTLLGNYAVSIGILTAFLTSIYSWRLFFITFFGNYNNKDVDINKTHESPVIMLIPLIILSFGAIFSGFYFKDIFIGNSSINFWQESIFFLNYESHDHIPLWLLIITPLIIIVSIPITYRLYIKDTNFLTGFKKTNLPLYNFLYNKWYIDELYDLIFVNPIKKLGLFLWRKGDENTIDKFGPNGISNLVKNLTNKAVKFQSGYIYDYAFVMLIGLSALITYLILN